MRPRAEGDERVTRVEEGLALPVIVAALVSVPAVFMSSMEGNVAQVGTVLNWASLTVLTGESIVLFLLAGDRLRWLHEHKLTVGVAVATVPAVIFAVGPVQLLRLVRFVGALRVIRVNRIIKAGRILRQRAGLAGVWRNAVAAGATLAAAAFVALVLADPTSSSRQLLEGMAGRFGWVVIGFAGLILGAGTFIVLRYRTSPHDGDEDSGDGRRPEDLLGG